MPGFDKEREDVLVTFFEAFFFLNLGVPPKRKVLIKPTLDHRADFIVY